MAKQKKGTSTPSSNANQEQEAPVPSFDSEQKQETSISSSSVKKIEETSTASADSSVARVESGTSIASQMDYLKSELNKELEALKKRSIRQIAEVEKKINAVQQEQDKNSVRMIEALAIFVTLFTFVSVNITIFSKIDTLSAAIWFMFLFTLSQLTLLSVFIVILNKDYSFKKWGLSITLLITMLALLVCSIDSKWLNPAFKPQSNEKPSEQNQSTSLKNQVVIPSFPIETQKDTAKSEAKQVR